MGPRVTVVSVLVHQGRPDSQGAQEAKENRVLEVSEDLLVLLESRGILVFLVLKDPPA